MAGYDDPRFLQQKIEALERDLRDLRARSLPFLVHQKGAIPGAMRAISINDPGLASTMWLALAGGQPGLGPYQAVSDPNGVVRAELGNLAANGNSPAQWGFRANDGSGNPIFDSLGLIAVGKLVAPIFIGSTITNWSSVGTNTLSPPSWNINFTAPRTCNYLVLGMLSAQWNQGTSVNTQWSGLVDVDNSGGSLGSPNWIIGSAFSTAPLLWVTNLTGGAHSIQIRSLDTGGGTGSARIQSGWFGVLQLGN